MQIIPAVFADDLDIDSQRALIIQHKNAIFSPTFIIRSYLL